MTFMRIWTALLAGVCSAFLGTLVGVAALGLLSSASIHREPLYDIFLLAWLATTILCAIPTTPLGQWLVAIRLSAFLFASLCLAALLTTREPVTLAVTAACSALLALLSHAFQTKAKG